MIYLNNAITLAMSFLGKKYSEEADEYLRRHYGHISIEWSLPPSFLWLWYEEDLDQFEHDTFDNEQNENLRIIRSSLYDLAYEVNDMFDEHKVTQSEAKVLYETICWIYLNKRVEAGCEVQVKNETEELKYGEKVIFR